MDIDEIKLFLRYEEESGLFYWIKDVPRKKLKGKQAGYLLNSGYVQITFREKRYQAHRLAYAFCNGCFPDMEIDHINGVRSDNRIANLRLASPAENGQNQKRSTRNTSGYIGVNWNKQAGKWFARICENGRRPFLGAFDSPEEAYSAYLKAKKDLHRFQPIPREQMEKAA